MRPIRTPTPSNTPRRIPHPTAEPNADLGPAVCQLKSGGRGARKLRSTRRIPDYRPDAARYASKLTTESKSSTSHETRDDGVPGVLLLPVALDGTVKGREQSTPDTEVSTENGSTSLNGRQRTGETLSLESLASVPIAKLATTLVVSTVIHGPPIVRGTRDES